MTKKKWYKWTVEFQVDASWVADGFNLTDDRAKQMIEGTLLYSAGYETKARVLSAPPKEQIEKEQGA